MKKKKLIPIALAVCALMLTGCQGAEEGKGTQPEAGAVSGETSQPGGKTAFTQFTATTLDGKETDQSIFSEYKLTMVNIWGTFCSPCIKEMPYLGELSREYAEKGVQILGIVSDAGDMKGNIDEAAVEKAKKIVEQTGADYPHLLPSMDLIRNKLSAVSSIPETVFVDAQGRQLGKAYIGALTKKEWAAIIDSLLEKVNGDA